MSECEKCKTQTEDLTDGLCEACQESSLPPSQVGDKPTPCLCGVGPNNKSSMMQCTECKLWWHPACVGLEGLSNYTIKKLSAYKCPRCFTLSPEIIEKLGIEDKSDAEPGSVKAEVQNEVKTLMPTIVKEVVAGVKAALGPSSVQQMVKEANDKISKSWADIAKTEQKKVIADVVEKTSDSAMQKSLSRISADLTEQKTRQRNCIISNVPEGAGGNDTSLSNVVCDLSDGILEDGDIAYCKRLGEKKTGTNRLILVVLKREDWAAEFHNFGRGRKLDNNVWVNPDLTRTEREAQFKAREKKREKRERPAVRDGEAEPTAEEEVIQPAIENTQTGTGRRRGSIRTTNRSNRD